MPVYAQNAPWTATRPAASSAPLFFALPAAETASENACIVSLYEYRHADSGQYLYDTDPQLNKKGWQRTEKPLCRVWKTPPGPLLLDLRTGPR